jgi:stage IV sporulation protein FB
MIQFKFLGIPVYIHPSFWIFFLFFTDLYRNFSFENFILGPILLISVLVHEYGHALTALCFGASPEINLEGMGGNARYSARGISDKQEFIITFMGPLLESILIFIPYYILKLDVYQNYYVKYALYMTMQLNIILCLINLIPVYPLDGGHLLRYLLKRKFGDPGIKASVLISTLTAFSAGTYFFLDGYFFFGCLLLLYGLRNIQMYHRIRPSRNSLSPFSLYNQGLELLKNNELQKAKLVFKKLLHSKDKDMKLRALESFAQALYLENKNKEAYKLLSAVDPALLKAGKCLLCKLAYEVGEYSLIEKHSREIYDIEPSYEIALLNSKAFAHLNNPYYSAGWLRTASLFENKQRDLEQILQEKIYDQVRNAEAFKTQLDKISSVEK